ncbi:FecR domain-containing protein [Flavobacterium sp. MFBS3-15]|uniref:FecR family protein n=1 Tax=Flavobacterium sp. MFBS3-15 TaxID=2989816 RepID=UPI0022358FB3|nr:FecR domain-containing protein [Flavobacterium sp. MFBS3-15]MCW4470561.1 FecR domain-containing protein [Flavobacterium sp. MFBS3-15]
MKDDVTLAKWLNNEMDADELKAFEASPEFATYQRIREYSAQLTAPEADMDSLYQSISRNRNRQQQPKVRRLNPWLPRIAAVLVILLGGTFFLYTTRTATEIAGMGERKEFLLPDNSEVVLNSGSEAKFRTWNWDGNRRIELDGEAYFKVAKGEKFDVVTDMGTVTVVGTQFNVKAREGRFDVTCFEGKVKVADSDESILLTPGKSVTFINGKLTQLPNQEDMQPGWITYETKFAAEKLQNVIEEMERQYKMDINLKTSLPGGGKKFTGTLPMNDIDTALITLETIYGLKAEKAGDKIILR